MKSISGGCLCGAVRYQSAAEPLMQVVCHCATCRKNSGSAFSTNVALPLDALAVEGEVATHEDRSGASGSVFHRVFCRSCGSPLYSHGAAYGAIAFVKAGTLDDAAWVSPDTHIWTAEKLPWVPIPEDATRFEADPG